MLYSRKPSILTSAYRNDVFTATNYFIAFFMLLIQLGATILLSLGKATLLYKADLEIKSDEKEQLAQAV